MILKKNWRGGLAMKTKAVIICDMWDNHHCISSDRRIGELAPKINNFISVCRSDNIKIIHGVSMCMEYYKDTKARQNVFNLPDVEVPNILWNKFSDILSTMLPTRISPNIRGQVTTCSCDTHKDTPCCGMEVYDPEEWQPIKQRDEIQIKSEDFIIDDKYLMEHKRASKKSTGLNLKVELQKSRKSGSCPSNRLYSKDFCHLVSVDVSEYTKVQNDYRFIVSDQLTENEKYLSKIKSMQKINNKNWYSGLSGLERALATISAQQAHLTADNDK